jgi:tRNA(fMet)-specific endonuclease VapC
VIYLLDTNACIAVINGSPQPVPLRLEQAVKRGEDVAVPAVPAFELWYGAAKSTRRQANVQRLESFFAGPLELLPFEHEDARAAGEIRSVLEARGTPIGADDLLMPARPGGTAPSWSQPTPRSSPVWRASAGRTGPRPADAARQGCGVVSMTTWIASRPPRHRRGPGRRPPGRRPHRRTRHRPLHPDPPAGSPPAPGEPVARPCTRVCYHPNATWGCSSVRQSASLARRKPGVQIPSPPPHP